jgi:2'-5' RNA ligase
VGRALRLFVGTFPPPEAAEAIHQAAGRALAGAPVRLVPAAEIHLTLRFLGATDEARVPGLCEALESATAGLRAPEILVRRTGGFPTAARSRVLWAGVDERAGTEGRLEALARAAWTGEEPDERWAPHLTVARPRGRDPVDPGESFRGLELDVGWTSSEVRLVESRPGAAGPERFVTLAGFRLLQESV